MKVKDIEYKRFDVDEGVMALEKLISNVKIADSSEKLLDLRKSSIELSKKAQTMNSVAYIRFTLNTEDLFYLSEKEYYDEKLPELMSRARDFNEAFLNNKYASEAFSKINPNVKNVYQLSARIMSKEIIPDLIKEAKVVTEYDKLISEMPFDFKGKKMPLSVLRRYFDDKNRTVRREAMSVCGTTLGKAGKKFDALFDELVKIRTKMAKKLGYDSYAPLGDDLMGRYSYGRDEIRKFRKAVVDVVVPAVSRIRQALAKNLGIKDMRLYDAEATLKTGNPEPRGSAKQLFSAAKKMYARMSPETGAFFESMLGADAFDVFARKGKWGGGYCTSIDGYAQPFILANFNGSSSDVDVLTHEAGHAFAYYEMFKNKTDYELSLGTMSVAEIHSMAMELLTYPYSGYFFDKPQEYKYTHLISSLTFIPYGTMVDHFQEICYEKPEMTPAQRNELWLELEKEYRPYMSAQGIPYLENGTRWQYQMHIYESPMYYIDYCLSQTVAHELFIESTKDYNSAFEKYLAIVRTAGEKPFEQLVTDNGLGSPFEKKVLENTVEGIEREINNLKRSLEE